VLAITSAFPVPAVIITLPDNFASDPPSLLQNLNIRVGNYMPWKSTANINDMNTLCAYRDGQLTSEAGAILRIPCTTPVVGRVVTVQIK
jgi:hypothetical protein